MENKYYTPEIEEFHVGFECEVNWSRAYSHDFEPFTFKICDEFPDGSRDCYCENISEALIAHDDGYAEFRVKYLDKEDIESLGWRHSHTFSGGNNQLTECFEINKSDALFRMFLADNNILSISRWKSEGSGIPNTSTLFSGTIKNKSELKKLMNQLNIK